MTKSRGPDGISNRILKYTANSIAKPLSTVFNMSLNSLRVNFQLNGERQMYHPSTRRMIGRMIIIIAQYHFFHVSVKYSNAYFLQDFVRSAGDTTC